MLYHKELADLSYDYNLTMLTNLTPYT